MSTYYEYKDVKVMIAHRLMVMDGWKVYGYRADESDSMTDYYSPASWDGIAEKNGYILVVNRDFASKEQEIKRYNRTATIIDSKTRQTIEKLEAITTNRGASEQEEQTAREKIELLKNKTNNNSNIPAYEVIGLIPAHQANPPRCNWHIEKDGVVILKGTGLLKYSSIYYDEKSTDKNRYEVNIEKLVNDYLERGYYSDRDAAYKVALNHKQNMDEKKELARKFDELIHKFDTTCGGIIGEGDLVTYERIKVTEYKTENKAVETTTGSIKEGQCFILKSNFNYGCRKGLVYRIHERSYDGKTFYSAVKLNGKLTKECTGTADQSNYFLRFSDGESLKKWIDKGSISFCEIKEVKIPYEVEKVIKKVIKPVTEEQPKEKKAEQPKEAETNNLTYDIKEDIDTRDNSKLFVVKIKEKLEYDVYIEVNKRMKQLGGYYSKFKKGFIFKDDPTELLTA